MRWNIQYAFCCIASVMFYNCIERVETAPFLTSSYCCKLVE